MKQQPFGKTTVSTTPIGVGMAALGRPGYINLGHDDDLTDKSIEAMEAHAHIMLDHAWEMGVRYFDTARSYGLGEMFLANWLTSRSIPTDAVTIGSKWGYTYTADWKITVPDGTKHEVKEHTLPVLNRQILESREILGDYLNIYHIHSATRDSGVLQNEAVLDRLAELRNEGLIVGLSVSGTGQSETIEDALLVQRDGRPLFQSIQVTWNLLEQATTNILQQAHANGVGIIVKEAVANGRLTPRNESDQHLSMLSNETGYSIDQLAIATVLNQPFVDVVLSGAANPAHLTSNLGGMSVEWTADLASQLAQFEEPSATYWATRSALTWN